MIDAGKLTDQFGRKITDLSQLSFSDTLAAGIGTLVDAIGDLIAAIAQAFHLPIPTRTRNGIPVPAPPSSIPDPTQPPPQVATGGLVTPWGIQHFARGGRVLPFARGTDTVPALLTPGEMVLNASQQRDLAAGLGGSIVVHFDQRGAFFGAQAGREIARIATDAIIRRVAENKGKAYTNLRGALGVAS